MIIFKKLFYKNFLSTGSGGIEIDFLVSNLTLCTGVSGAGKSTLIDALCFVLYGRSFRAINKGGLVNSINNKELEVVLDLELSNRPDNKYRIVRGIKPNKLEIYINENLVTQDSAVKDYQAYLENEILQLNYRTFTQIIVLGSVNYTPFMQLPSAGKTEVIENILDISIFNKMGVLCKEELQETKQKFQNLEIDIRVCKEKIEGIKKVLEVLEESRHSKILQLKENISSIKNKVNELAEQIKNKAPSNDDSYKNLQQQGEEFSLIEKKLVAKLSQLAHSRKENEKAQVFFSTTTSCSVCKQEINEGHKTNICQQLKESNLKLKQDTEELERMYGVLKGKVEKLQEQQNNFNKERLEITKTQSEKSLLESQLKDYTKELEKLENKQSEENTHKKHEDALKLNAIEYKKMLERKETLSQERQLQEVSLALLRDSGIKTIVIREYLPLINKFINSFLSDLQMDVMFLLNECFEETIKSRKRDEFVYGNFSTGEKTRIDVALMLTWRQIAMMKNSGASTNLLIIDELMNGVLDQENQEIMINLITQIAKTTGTNVFVIAHNVEDLADRFERTLNFEKRGNWSVVN